MVSTPGVFTHKSPMSLRQYATANNPNARKSLNHFLDTLEVKPKTAVRRFFADKYKCKSIRSGSMLWYIIPKNAGILKNQSIGQKISLHLESTTSSCFGVSNSR